METLILIAGLVIIFWFRNAIRQTAGLAENLVTVVAVTGDDSLKTYANNVAIMNAKQRSDQVEDIDSIDNVVSNDDISAMLAGLQADTKPTQAKSDI